MDSAAQPHSPPPAPLRTTSLPSGTILLGKYQLGRLLGRGSFAKVQQAHCIATGSAVAVKIIDKKKTVDAAMEPRIIREIDAMRRLHHHPNILKIHEVMATKSKIYLVMELATGGELFSKVLRRGRLPESEVRRYFQQLTSALRFCHKNGIAHRDVKPQNLLLDKDGNLKVADFGLSALPEHIRNGMLQTACGTPAYTAPEVVARRGYDGAKADAWSCGVILFVLLAGYVPFDDSNIATMYRKIQRRDYRFPSWISKSARSIIHQLLDPNPETRMSLNTVERTSWFRKSLETSNFERSMFDWGNSLQKDVKSNIGSITAFDLISLSSGLDLSGLLEARKRKVKRFTARVSAEGVAEKARDLGKKLGYIVEERKGVGTAVALGRDGAAVVVVVEAVEIAAETVVAEVKVVEGEEEEERWEEFKRELEEIVRSWHYDVI